MSSSEVDWIWVFLTTLLSVTQFDKSKKKVVKTIMVTKVCVQVFCSLGAQPYQQKQSWLSTIMTTSLCFDAKESDDDKWTQS